MCSRLTIIHTGFIVGRKNMKDVKLKTKLRAQGEGNYYVRIPKVLIDSEVLHPGKKYEVILIPLDEDSEICETNGCGVGQDFAKND